MAELKADKKNLGAISQSVIHFTTSPAEAANKEAVVIGRCGQRIADN
jgi:hypothetical protein